MNVWLFSNPGDKVQKRWRTMGQICPVLSTRTGPCPLDWRITAHSIINLVFSSYLDIYDYVGKLPEQHFSVWLCSNPGDNILFLLKFNEARISEWILDNVRIFPEISFVRTFLITTSRKLCPSNCCAHTLKSFLVYLSIVNKVFDSKSS